MDPSEPEQDERGRLDNLGNKDGGPNGGASAPPGPGKDKVYDYGATEPSPTPGNRFLNRVRHPFGGGKPTNATAVDGQSPEADEKKSLYRKTASANTPSVWRLDRRLLATRRRKVWFTLGLAITGVSIFGMFSFLGVFKLDFLMNNIDQHSFARLNGSIDARNSRYVQTYMRLRLADLSNNITNIDTDNLVFRSDKVRTGNPIHDWYRTLRTSSFEKDLFEKHGIKFVSVAYREGNQIKFRPGRVEISGKKVFSAELPEDLRAQITKAYQSGSPSDWVKVNESDWTNKYFDLEKFDSNKDAKLAIKNAVKEETYFFQVFKRHYTRKAIQNMTGIRSWRFFDKTRTKIHESKIAMRNSLVKAMLPDSTRTGQFVQCLLGISDCKFSKDSANPASEATGTIEGSDKVDPNANSEGTVDGKDANGKTVVAGEVDFGPAKEIFNKIVSQGLAVFNVTNWVSMLDMLAKLQDNIANHKLSEGVALARTSQSMALYQVFETARDQIKTGQVDGAEVNNFMGDLGPITNNEGYATVVEHKAAPTTTTKGQSAFGLFGSALAAGSTINRASYCKADHQKQIHDNPSIGDEEFGYQCPDKTIGSASNAKVLEDGWNSTIGAVVGPLVSVYNSVRHSFLGGIIDFAEKVIGDVSSAIVKGIIDTLGLGSDLQALGTYVATNVSGFLGAGPMLNCPSVDKCGQSPTSDKVNIMAEGAAATQEASLRNRGAALTTPVAAATARTNLAFYETETNSANSIYTRLFSLNNPDSPTAKTAFAASNMLSGGAGNKLSLSSLFHGLTGGFASLFGGHPALAASSDAYAGANLAQIQTYDYPQQCFDSDPLTAQPLGGTNVLTVFSQFGIPVDATSQAAFNSWDTESNSDKFYQTLYNVLNNSDYAKNGGDTDTVAQQIYNCNLLDTSVRDGLGTAYGYHSSDGLAESSTTSTLP